MANRNSSTQATSNATEVAASSGFTLQLPHSVTNILENDVLDHASMRANQLAALTLMISGDGVDVFNNLGHAAKDSLLWLVQQMAMEVADMVRIIGDQAPATPRGASGRAK